MTFRRTCPDARWQAFARWGLTLPELLLSMAIMSLMSVVLAGMSHAVNSAWTYTTGVDATEQQASAVLDRIKFMVAQAGIYRVTGQPTRLGVAVVSRSVGTTIVPDVLVLWTGGRNGGMAALGAQTRLPQASELLVYTWSSDSPNQLIEVAFPSNTTAVDFAASNFADTVAALLALPNAERIAITDRLRVSSLSSSTSSSPLAGYSGSFGGGTYYPGGSYSGPTGSGAGSTTTSPSTSSAITLPVGGIRFGVAWTPSDEQLATVTSQTSQWLALTWPQGAVSSQSGMRQATVNIELQIEPDGIVAGSGEVTAIPFFAAASRLYVYQP